MAELLATMVVGPLVSMVKEKASSYLLDQYQVMAGLEKQHKLLKRKLPAILDVITDAEEQAAAKREGAKAWLEEVREVAYHANDVLDEFKYEALRRKAKEEGHYKELGMDVIKLFPSHNRIMFRFRMGNKLRIILQELDTLIIEMNAFRFKFRNGSPVPINYLRQHSSDIIDPMNIARRSRAGDKQKVIKALLDKASNVNLMIFPIVAMGGMGKTTLAQLVYNDADIKKYFQLRLWVCVSDNFDVDSLAKRIVEENGCQSSGISALDKLQTLVSGKRYLLVLDDVWNREAHKWEKLKSYLRHGGSGSSVMITTRDKQVAQLMMGTTEGAYRLESLGEDFIEEIIKTRAFSSKQEDEWPSELVGMVGDVVKRCAGSPLAATALGSVLSTMTTMDEWKVVLSRRMISDEKNGILPILKLSYNCLPSYMRQCFAFCAIFPKDYEIDVETLIQLWMANGFIPEQQGVHPEISGKNIFIELASRSFFQDVKGIPFEFNDVGVTRVTCKIHDLMHDVALDSMGKECTTITTGHSKSEEFSNPARYLLLSVYKPETLLSSCQDKGSLFVQTLICDEEVYEDLQHMSKYRSARALKIRIKQASFLKPKFLHHLRYLDLSKSCIESLPEDMSILYHLQSLNISDCIYLERLPKGMKYMTSLRHLYTHRCWGLKSMPADLRHLTSLQTLTWFVAGAGAGCSKVGELGQLDDLGGQLELRQLENVQEADAKAAKLVNKKKLARLSLRWTEDDKETQNSHKVVLEGLEPHEGLKILRIYSYHGDTCPTWMNKLQGLVELELSDCKKLNTLPAIWQLPSLQFLCLWRLPNFDTWWGTSDVQGEKPIFSRLEKLSVKACKNLVALPKASLIAGSSGGVDTMWRSAFPSLQELKLEDLEMFQQWEAGKGTLEEQVIFPRLEKLSLKRCKSLAALPKATLIAKQSSGGEVDTLWRSAFPALREMELDYLEMFQRWELGNGTLEQVIFPRLEKLSLKACKSLSTLPKAPLIAESFEGVDNMWYFTFPPLREMELDSSEMFQRWEVDEGTLEQEVIFPHLEKLPIKYCKSLATLPNASLIKPPFGGVETELYSAFPALRELELDCLEMFQRWEGGEGTLEKQVIFPQLEKLSINYCKSLAALPKASVIKPTFGGVETECRSAFPALRELELDCLEIFQRWEGGEGTLENQVMFPQLEKLSINYCKSLAALPKASVIKPPFGGVENECRSAFPALRELELINLTSLERWDIGHGTRGEELTFPRLEKLIIRICPELTTLPEAPKLSVLYVSGVSHQILSAHAASRYIGSLHTLDLTADGEATEVVLEQNLNELMHVMEKWDHKSPLRDMNLRGCDILLSHSSALALWTSFTQLVDLDICRCNSLVYWPEKVFQALVSLRSLIIEECSKLTGHTQEASEQSALEQNGSLPCLEFLKLSLCESLVEVPNLPASLKTLSFYKCHLESIVFGQKEDTRSFILGSTDVPALSSSADHRFLQCLESLNIESCSGLSEISNLPPSIKTLKICSCKNLRSLSGQLDALQTLHIDHCSSLESLPNGPQAYSSLRVLWITSCYGIKLLPQSLQQRLDHLEEKKVDARYEADLAEQKTWKFGIRRPVCLK